MASSDDEDYSPENERKKRWRKSKKKARESKKKSRRENIAKTVPTKRRKIENVNSKSPSVVKPSARANLKDTDRYGQGTSREPVVLSESEIEEESNSSSNDPSYSLRRDISSVRVQNLRQTRSEGTDTLFTEDFPFQEPEILPVFTLGDMSECFYCAAIHYPGKHKCCLNGKVFIPPLSKLPEPLETLFYEFSTSQSKKFLKNIIMYNANFSFASTQYSRNPVAKFGVQAVRARGAVHHYPSAVLPHSNRDPVFGNVYVYQGSQAVDIRMKSQFSANFDSQIMEQIQQMLELHDPLAEMYHSMGRKLEMLENAGENVEHLRLKIVDPSKVDSKLLQAHEGVYGKPIVHKDYIAMFYTSSIEQIVDLPGFIVYPKHGPHISRPLFPWSDLIDPLCYPLLFPKGERGWNNKKFPYNSERQSSKSRLELYAASHPEEALLWDTPIGNTTNISEIDPNLEDSASEPEENDENVNDIVYNAQLNVEEGDEEQEEDDIIEFEERGGVMYPIRVRQIPEDPERTAHVIIDDLAEDSGNEGDEDESYEADDNRLVNDVANESSIRDDPAIQEENPHEITHRKFASYREYILYRMQLRRDFKNRFIASGKLGQLFLIDSCTRLFRSRSEFIQKHHSEFMSSTKKKFLDAYQRRIEGSGRKIGCITSIPSSVPGSPRYLQKKYEDIVALANEHGAPDLFITFTANVNWPEIQDIVAADQTWADYPFVVNDVFSKKFEKFMNVVLGELFEPGLTDRRPGLFGPVKWWTYVVEFQQRGPPHVHMIVSLLNHVRTAADVDKICQATIPPLPDPDDICFEEKTRLRKLVSELMIHRPCEHDPEAYCQINKPSHWKTCKKHFPKEFSTDTHFGDLTYPELRRPDDGSFVMVKSSNGKHIKATNRHVVPYNTQLTTMFESHINVEVISSLRSVKYIFKYLFKSYDRAVVETITSNSNQVSAGHMVMDGHIMYPKSLPLTKEVINQRNIEAAKRLKEHRVNLKDENELPILMYDETHFVEDLRSLTSCEAAWEFAGYPRNGCSHSVVTVFVHPPQDEPIHYELESEDDMYERLGASEVPSRLKAWFELNNSQDLHAQSLLYNELPKSYRYVKDHWVKRKIRLHHIIGRVKAVHVRNKQLFAIRLLSLNKRNVTSFQSLRTVEGVTLPTFVEAAKAMNLMNDQREWDFALEEAARDGMPIHLRRLFASILLFCAPDDPLGLWEKYKEQFYENKSHWSVERKEAHALFHIQSILKYHGTSLSENNLPTVNEEDLPPVHEQCNDSGTTNMPSSIAERIASEMYQKMNGEQKDVFDRVVDSICHNERKSFFINGCGGSGKTFIYNALCKKLSANHKVLCVAHTGIAAILLPGGRTAHRAFRIPLTTEDNMRCKINMEDDYAADLTGVNVVLWDEATMTDRRILEAVDKLMCALHSNNSSLLFGGVPFVFGGDWKQTLPILKEIRGPGILAYTMLRSTLWEEIEVLHLTQNVRAVNDPQYATFLMKVGKGENKNCDLPEEEQKIDLPSTILASNEQEVIDFVFGNGQILNPASNAAILTADNASSIDLNEKILQMLPGEAKQYRSIDTFDENSGFSMLDAGVYNQLTPKGMPPHKLNLKVGAVVMLLRNINTEIALTNGTRLRILKLGDRILTCEPILKECNSPELVFLPRMMLSTSIQATSRDLAFHRFQFPIRLSYAMTIHKSQGQTLSKVGVILRTPVFSHGQLYVALSRVRCIKDIKIFNIKPNNGEATNVVYKSIFSLI